MFTTKKKSETTTMINTIIGDNSRIEGQLIASESTRVDGTLRGKILSESTVIIGEHGVIYGDIDGFEILVAGTVYGNLHAEQRIQLTETGRVIGDLFTKTLVIDEGASFKGRCTMETMEELSEPENFSLEKGTTLEVQETIEPEPETETTSSDKEKKKEDI
ncbi:MAG: polymer-forming cytoskeletal protein [Lachnospiraceae bacterium]|nr:polymer-forming cytoskeletal protein [Lachnospiraceae bacterium]